EADVRLLQAGDEAAVAQAEGAAGDVDAVDPQAAVVALLELATDEGLGVGAHDRLGGDGPHAVAASAEALGAVETTLLGLMTGGTVGGTHGRSPAGFWPGPPGRSGRREPTWS